MISSEGNACAVSVIHVVPPRNGTDSERANKIIETRGRITGMALFFATMKPIRTQRHASGRATFKIPAVTAISLSESIFTEPGGAGSNQDEIENESPTPIQRNTANRRAMNPKAYFRLSFIF